MQDRAKRTMFYHDLIAATSTHFSSFKHSAYFTLKVIIVFYMKAEATYRTFE